MSLNLGNEHVYTRNVNISRSHLEAPTFQKYSYVQFLEINHKVENAESINIGTSEALGKFCIDLSSFASCCM